MFQFLGLVSVIVVVLVVVVVIVVVARQFSTHPRG